MDFFVENLACIRPNVRSVEWRSPGSGLRGETKLSIFLLLRVVCLDGIFQGLYADMTDELLDIYYPIIQVCS